MSRNSVAEAQPRLMDEAAPSVGLSPAVAHGEGLVLMFERLASNPQVDVAKLERLIAMQERILAHNAKAAFDAAFSAMQPEIPEIDEKGKITGRTGDTQSTYAKNEDMQKVLKPILARHGFTLSFRTEWPDKSTVKVIGILTHREGHERNSEFLSAADSSGNKNAIQALGSAVSYGHRYTTKDLLNITSRAPLERDDDGDHSEDFKKPDTPEGYDAWWAVIDGVAKDGWQALSKAWNDSKVEYRNYTTKHRKRDWDALRDTAQQVKK